MKQFRKHKTKDSTLAYYVNQLENFDQKLHEPLVSVSWGRDIKLRPGITMANESTSFTRSTFAGAGTLDNSDNMPFVSEETNDIPGISVDGEKLVKPLRLLAREVSYTSPELDRSQLTGQPIDVQKLNGFNTLYQMNTDRMVYVGAASVGATGLLNDADITTSTVANGATGSPLWQNKTADEILADVNTLLASCWEDSAFAICPTCLRLPPVKFTYLTSQKVSSAGNVSILKFLQDNSISLAVNGKPLDIQPIKWLTGLAPGPVDRMMVYTNDLNLVRFPMVPVRRETAYYRGIRFFAPYLWAFGEVEFVYPETVQYADGI